MQRLSRQFCASSRLFRRQNVAIARHIPRRCYAVEPKLFKLPEGLAEGRYAQFYRLVRPDLGLYDLARVAAALITFAKDDLQLQRVYLLLENNFPELDQRRLLEQVNRCVQTPPPDNFESLLTSLPTAEGDMIAPEELERAEGPSKGVTLSRDDFYIANNLDEFIEVMSVPEARKIISGFTDLEKLKYRKILSQIPMSNGQDDPVMMHHLAEFLTELGLKVRCNAKLPKGPKPEEPSLGDLERELESGANDPLTLAARRAQADASPVNKSVEIEERPYPNLMSPDPLMDSRDVLDLPPTPTNPYHNRVIVRNHHSMFHEALALDGFNFDDENWRPIRTDLSEEEIATTELAGLDRSYPIDKLFTFPLLTRWTTQQTGKGKIKHFQTFTVTGNGNGMVGMGMGTAEEAAEAFIKARIAALKNMDYVDRFEDRTIWTEMETKFGSTKIHMRPRPVGFGLRCGPIMHQILKAAGIKDISGKVWGSRNPMMIMHATLRMLQGGHNPLGMGDGIGGRGKRLHKGTGMRTAYDVERERGRKLMNFRTG
ncbi:28S ribosomal protein S5, mitochondrial [Stygiomarasmius scandens]|uniref:28S ribosomal protein S5, mitochondrial n=1 Tax=Marasmiellus scandens TaxID=2682957 RepID=A0ABR1ITR5_9AGAR